MRTDVVEQYSKAPEMPEPKVGCAAVALAISLFHVNGLSESEQTGFSPQCNEMLRRTWSILELNHAHDRAGVEEQDQRLGARLTRLLLLLRRR